MPPSSEPAGPAQRSLLALGVVTCLIALLSLARARDATAGPVAAPGGATDASREEGPPPAGPIDLNAASVEDLERLPRIGPALAGRIAEHRPYASVDELERVPGIGPRTIERLRALVTVSSRAGSGAGVER